MNTSPRTVLSGAAVLVGIGAAALPAIHVYPTMLSLVIALCAWGAVAFLKSPHFADTHFLAVWTVAVLLHMIAFAIPAVAIFIGLRKRRPKLCAVLVAIWCLCYLALLFFLIRASAGP